MKSPFSLFKKSHPKTLSIKEQTEILFEELLRLAKNEIDSKARACAISLLSEISAPIEKILPVLEYNKTIKSMICLTPEIKLIKISEIAKESIRNLENKHDETNKITISLEKLKDFPKNKEGINSAKAIIKYFKQEQDIDLLNTINENWHQITKERQEMNTAIKRVLTLFCKYELKSRIHALTESQTPKGNFFISANYY